MVSPDSSSFQFSSHLALLQLRVHRAVLTGHRLFSILLPWLSPAYLSISPDSTSAEKPSLDVLV